MAAEEETDQEVIHTKIWQEEPETDNPFVASKCFCAGYDVYGDILEKATWIEYVYLLFKRQRPEHWQAELLEKIAIAIANPGIRDHSIRAAMNAGVGGSTSASALMAALAVGAGQLSGAREVYLMMEWCEQGGKNLEAWKGIIKNPPRDQRESIWGNIEHTPGFDPHGVSCANPVLQTLKVLSAVKKDGFLSWLMTNRESLEECVKSPLSMSGVIACAFIDLGFNSDEGEMCYLMLRLPGAAVHALEQKNLGWKKYPFFGAALKVTNDPE